MWRAVELRAALARSALARAAYHRLTGAGAATVMRAAQWVSYESLPVPVALRLAYQVMLGRDPDPVGFSDFTGRLRSGAISRREIVHAIRASEEFQTRPFPASMLGPSVHAGRGQFIRSLPPAQRIVDLGGTHLAAERGAMITLGYPYPFSELVIVDLPAGDRHAIYRSDDSLSEVATPLGPVRYRFHSMVDLSSFADDSVDLVYSGQSFEHVTPDDGMVVLKEVHRILRPGGHLALDTPNGRVTRLQQPEFIDPDHKVEYTWPELAERIQAAGFTIERAQGLNWGGRAAAEGRFDADAVAGHCGVYDDVENCYILAVVCAKPLG